MFTFTQGLFTFDFTDHHAILGVSLDAKFPEIRKRYMRVARRLHPDTCPFENEKDKEFANQLLSKLVSPAYNKFSKESDRAELFVILNKLGNTVTQQRSQITFTTDAAKQIAKVGDYQEKYKVALEELSDRQYESLDKTLEIIGEISELNLAYLMRKQPQGGGTVLPPPPPVKPPVNQEKPTTAKPKAQNPLVEQACSRAESLISTKNYAKAILELKGALKTDPNHSRCHALLGLCYLQQKQGTMAKIQIKKALSLNPKEPKALEVKKLLEQAVTGNNTKKRNGKVTAKTEKKGNKTDKGGGLFGGFFGGNKK
ncbi:molecular chaperone DnaJ [Hydrocoleum sp. CS-953]|uniref:J domain-containing protein n=1 Tax=Hydrocoleum sp. CS-953 TaxID=1671698 RepID=UPI000B9BAD9B|nr:J domain-containing protein [Hydrocoleum sp. CS-953]OZH53656.1 molecular chaperone DnaJ [Hydrocoleum sp. CS-953]